MSCLRLTLPGCLLPGCLLLGGLLAATAPAEAGTVLFLIGEREYGTAESLPRFAHDHLEPAGHDCIFVTALGDAGEDRNRFPGASLIDQADLLVISLRRRSMRKSHLDAIRQHLDDGKPLVALRTSSHGFDPKGDVPAGHDTWRSFDVDVLGARYENHLRNRDGTTITPFAEAKDHPILAGAPSRPWHSGGTLYRMLDLDPNAQRLATGMTVIDGQTLQFPVAWTRTLPSGSRIFATTLGGTVERNGQSLSDFAQPSFVAMMTAAVAWCLDEPVGPVAAR